MFEFTVVFTSHGTSRSVTKTVVLKKVLMSRWLRRPVQGVLQENLSRDHRIKGLARTSQELPRLRFNRAAI